MALDALDDDELAERLRGEAVIARATPEDKLRLVRVLQEGRGRRRHRRRRQRRAGPRRGERRHRHGRCGTDLAREASDLVLVDDAYPTIVGAVAGGRGLASQLRRAVAFYLGAKIALVVVIAAPLVLGLPAPFHPVHIVILELFMDVGASVAFVSEPPAPGAMDHPPRDPARRFLDGTQLSAIALTAVALTTAVLPAFLLVHAQWGIDMAIAAAVAGWLVANVAIAWSLRARPASPLAAQRRLPRRGRSSPSPAPRCCRSPRPGPRSASTRSPPGRPASRPPSQLSGVAIAVAGRAALSLSRRL